MVESNNLLFKKKLRKNVQLYTIAYGCGILLLKNDFGILKIIIPAGGK